jgi:hypothetical protein
MYSGISSVLKISSGSRSRLKSKKDESRDCNQDQEKSIRRKITLEWSWGFSLEEEDERT